MGEEAVPLEPSADFSDHDDVYAEDEARWRDVLFGEDVDGKSVNITDPSVRASLDAFFGQSVRGAYGSSLARPDIDDGVVDPVTKTGGEYDVSEDRGARSGAGELGPRPEAVSFDAPAMRQAVVDPLLTAAADVISAGAEDLWAPVEFGLAYADDNGAWWRQGENEARFSDSALLPIALDPIVDGLSASAGVEQLSQHQKLTQALASFGRDKGASAAVWRRSGEIDGQDSASQMLSSSGSRFAALARIPA